MVALIKLLNNLPNPSEKAVADSPTDRGRARLDVLSLHAELGMSLIDNDDVSVGATRDSSVSAHSTNPTGGMDRVRECHRILL